MGESLQSLFRRGAVSSRAADKPSILRQTRMNPSFGQKEEKFSGKQGLGDQAGADWKKPFDGGDRTVASSKAIDLKQSKGTPALAGGAPRGGASAGKEKQPTRKAAIDDTSMQEPKFPKGAGFKTGFAKGAGVNSQTYVRSTMNAKKLSWKDNKGKAKWKTPPKAAGGKIASNKNQYGDPASGRKYG
jgi:hypothetical protein